MMTISYTDMMERLHSGQAFSAKFVKYDRRRGGGAIRSIEAVSSSKENAQPKTHTSIEKSDKAKLYTRKVSLIVAGIVTSNVIDIHPPLILVFDGKKVTR